MWQVIFLGVGCLFPFVRQKTIPKLIQIHQYLTYQKQNANLEAQCRKNGSWIAEESGVLLCLKQLFNIF
jgi:hypothetical protein